MTTKRKRRSRRNKHKRPCKDKSNNNPKKSIESKIERSWSGIFRLIGVVASISGILGIIFQLLVSRPVIIIDKIDQRDEDFLDTVITIKNSGSTNADNVKIDFSSPYIISETGVTFRPAEGKDPKFTGLTKIVSVMVPPDQPYKFNLKEFADLSYKVDRASIKLIFRYKDFLYIPYTNYYYLIATGENNILKWEIISESYYKENVVDKW